MIKAEAWLVVKAKRRSYGKANAAGQYPVDSARIAGCYVNRPDTPDDGEVVKVCLEFPDDYFDHNAPSVVIAVPSSANHAPITTTAQVTKGKAPSAAAAVLKQASSP